MLAVPGLVIVAAAAGCGGGGGTVGGGPASSAGVPSSGSAGVPGIGQRVRDGTFEFVVTKVTHATSVGPAGFRDTAQGRFTILHLTVTNIGNESQPLDDGSQFVFDVTGRKFDASTTADLHVNGGENRVFLEDINPGKTVRGMIAFDLPSGVRAVKAELHDLPLSGGVTVGLSDRS
jgi:hypothetical protein